MLRPFATIVTDRSFTVSVCCTVINISFIYITSSRISYQYQHLQHIHNFAQFESLNKIQLFLLLCSTINSTRGCNTQHSRHWLTSCRRSHTSCLLEVCFMSWVNVYSFSSVTHTHARAHARTHTHTHARTHTDTHTHTNTLTHARTHTHTHTHTDTQTHIHSHTHTHTHTRMHARTNTQTHNHLLYFTNNPPLTQPARQLWGTMFGIYKFTFDD